jgi:hypothetical protein
MGAVEILLIVLIVALLVYNAWRKRRGDDVDRDDDDVTPA